MFWLNGFWCYYFCIFRFICYSGLVNYIFLKFLFLLIELLVWKFYMLLRFLIFCFLEFLGNNILGRVVIIREIFKVDKIKKEGKNICKKVMLCFVIDLWNLLFVLVFYLFKGCFFLGEGRVIWKNNMYDFFVIDCSNGVVFCFFGVVFEFLFICWFY